MIRSLHINTERTWRGGEKQTLHLVTGLLKRDHEAELICPPGSPLEERAREAGVKVHGIPMRGEADLIAIGRIRRLLKQGDFDVLQMHTSHAHALGVLARGWKKKPLTIVNRRVDFSIHRRGLFGLNRIKYRYGVDRYIAISHAIRNVLVSDGIDADNIQVVHSGVDPLPVSRRSREQVRADYGIESDHFLVGNVAHLAGHKGQSYLIQAIAELHADYPQLRALIVGEGESRPDLEQQIEAAQLNEVIHLAGFQDDVAAYLSAFDLFVMPSVMEGLCTSILDALQATLPVIGSDTGGIPEIVRHEQTGLLARPADPSHLASQIASMVDDPAQARAFADSGHALVSEEFSVDRMVEGTLGVYEQLLERA